MLISFDTTGVKMADGAEANTIVSNYRRFYEVCLHYADTTLTGTDSTDIETMAQLCPTTNGAVVYKARALYNLLYDTVRIFESHCDGEAEPTDPGIKANDTTTYNTRNLQTATANGQGYLLYPNPNDGNFTVQQVVMDDKPVNVEIYDVVGRSVYKGNIVFTGAKATLEIQHVASGVYMLQLTNNKKQTFRFKFVVE